MYPLKRNRRLRNSIAIRAMVQENSLSIDDLIVPLFVVEGENIHEENDGYRTDVSEMKELDFDDKSVDWEQSDNEL